MAQIKVEASGIQSLQSRMMAQYRAMSQVESIIASVSGELDMQIAATADINRILNNLRHRSNSQEQLLNSMSGMLNKVCDDFQSTDRSLSRQAQGVLDLGDIVSSTATMVASALGLKGIDLAWRVGKLNELFGIARDERGHDAVVKVNQAKKKSVGDYLKEKWDGATNAVSNAWKNVKTGVAEAVDATKKTVAGWVDDYKAKGTVFKVAETAKAVGAIVGSGAAIVGAWAVSAMTAGAGAPGAILVSGYAANDIANQITDIKNCWWGDVNQVNEVNHLEDMLEDGGGDIAESLGFDREAGERFGSGLYTTGELLTVVTQVDDLMGKVVQAPDLLATAGKSLDELKTTAGGVVDIALHSNLADVAKDFALLKYQIPNLVETVGTGGVIYDLGKTAIDIGSKGVSILSDVVGGIAAAWN